MTTSESDDGCAHDHDHSHDHDHAQDQAQVHAHTHSHGQAGCASHAHDQRASATARSALPPSDEVTALRISQMDCPTEEALLRHALGKLPAVKGLQFDLMQRTLTVAHDKGALEGVMQAVRALGFTPQPKESDGPAAAVTPPARSWWPLVVSGVLAMGAEVVHWLSQPGWMSAALALAAIALCGLITYKKGWIALRHGMFNINALMSVAVTGALVLGQWAEAAMVMVLFTLAEVIEARSLDRARRAISGLMALAPDRVTRLHEDGRREVVSVSDVALDDQIEVRPGERIGLDGRVVLGESTVNQAPITGESMPADKSAGDPVYAGTINGMGTLTYQVTAAAGHTTLARIIKTVEEAQSERAPTQRFVDRFARVYTPAVMLIALLVAVLPPLLAGTPWTPWIYKALVLLVIACPCALVISTPVTVVSGLTRAARMGILIKGGVYLEMGRLLKVVALDKTGTLTSGQPVQTDAICLAGDAVDVMARAARLAGMSDHPVSRAIAQAAVAPAGLAVASPAYRGESVDDIIDVQAVAGQGVRGTIAGVTYALGNARMAAEMGHGEGAHLAQLRQLEQQGKTVVLFMTPGQVLALFAVADTIKPESRDAIAALHALGVQTLMLTGDNAHTAATIAGQAGVADYRSEQLPQDKLAAIETLAGEGRVAMVGDGINDAPALARADIGFAMGAVGTDSAIETADVALMNDDLRNVPAFISLSRRTHRILVQNIVMALGIKLVFLLLTVAGLGSMWMAVFADVGASLLVIANGLRVMRAPARV